MMPASAQATQDQDPVLQLTLPADAGHIRKALKQMTAFLELQSNAGIAEIGDTELVLAEILNNVVEHAFRSDTDRLSLNDQMDGETIRLELLVTGSRICGRITDCGRPMPGNAVPQPTEHDVTADLMSLPEGGFGWALIHNLTETVTYYRNKSENVLEFVIALEAA